MVNVVTIAAYRRIYWLRLISLVQRSAATWRCVLHSSDEPGELSQWQCHDDNTINIVVAVTIINQATLWLSTCVFHQ